MFKTTDRISKAMDMVIKAAEELKNEERKQQAIEVAHQISVLHSNCFDDLKSNTEEKERAGI